MDRHATVIYQRTTSDDRFEVRSIGCTIHFVRSHGQPRYATDLQLLGDLGFGSFQLSQFLRGM